MSDECGLQLGLGHPVVAQRLDSASDGGDLVF
jgi:hypothetical protein